MLAPMPPMPASECPIGSRPMAPWPIEFCASAAGAAAAGAICNPTAAAASGARMYCDRLAERLCDKFAPSAFAAERQAAGAPAWAQLARWPLSASPGAASASIVPR
eukprot:5081243-Pleurochrysis_carterae.AAC.1